MLAVWPQHATESVILQEFLDEYYSEKNFRQKLKKARKSHKRKKSRSHRHKRKRNHNSKVSSLQFLSMVSEMVSHMGNGQGKSKVLDGRFR